MRHLLAWPITLPLACVAPPVETATTAPAPAPWPSLGFRGDNAAHFPSDCRPPATISDPAQRAQVVAQTARDRYQDWYGWHESCNAPFASGNRLFLRTFDHLYCNSDKGQPFAPSAAFSPADGTSKSRE